LNAIELLNRLDAMGVQLKAADGRLLVRAARGRLDDALKQAISDNKSELLTLLVGRDPVEEPPLPRVAPDGQLPLSLFQERLWILQQLEPDSTTYLTSAIWRAPENAPLNQLVSAIQRVHARQLGLRVVFTQEDDAPPRAVRAEVPEVRIHDLRQLSREEQTRRVDADVERAVSSPMDLAKEVPARFDVYTLSDDTRVVRVAAHHIAVDAWSLQILMRDIERELCSHGVPESASPQPLQYADYAAWQRQTYDPGAMAVDLEWWEDALKGAPQTSAFPFDLPASDNPARGATVNFELDAELRASLLQCVRGEHATLYMAFLAACAALLRVHTGQSDLLIGSPMGLRERPEFEDLVGPFVNLQVVRLRLDDDPSFFELLRRARNALLDAHAHRGAPFESVVERVRPVRSVQYSPLFQVAVVYHNAPVQGDMLITSGGAPHELTWYAHEYEGRIACSLEYRSDLYSAEMMQRIAEQLQTFLKAAVAEPGAPISRLSVLSPTERSRLLIDFNASTAALDRAPFARQLERQAAETPSRIAVGFEGSTLCYDELNHRANQWARHLRGLGVRAGVHVAVCMERSIEMLVALVAVHKSGGAYVPLDPGFPEERLAYMLEDSGAQVLIASGEAADAVVAPTGVQVFDPSIDADKLGAFDVVDLDTDSKPGDCAYVIYTSGSTGRPKGVSVSHEGLSNFLGSMKIEPGLSADDTMAAVTTISFDIAGLELYLPLLVGARVEILSRETASDGVLLAEQLEACGATVLQATPATWRLLLEADWRPAQALRAFCGGESLPRDLADALLDRVHGLWNLYGPTETTIWSTVERVAPSPAAVTIGRPIANTQVYVLDAQNEPTPVGVPGELWIGGAGVALGYHQRPELTAERFVADHLSALPGARLYRTGDLARWDVHGRLHHLGRLDHQVKIRGFRIELGEIEVSLATHAAVQQAVVIGREAGPGDLRLVAYVVFRPGHDLTASDVRRYLRRNLPDYMIPSVVAAVDAIPLTPNGKVDRAALPDPFKNAVQPGRQYVAPEPGAEQTMAEIWREILRVDVVSAEDNFFELGGHSLLSLRVMGAVEKRLGWRMDARTLFFQNLRQVVASAASGKRGVKA
jgi:amino acid adenylation domain-containing protein